MAHSLAASLGALLGGALFDALGSYDAALAVCAAVCAVGGVACALLLRDEPLIRGAATAGGGVAAAQSKAKAKARRPVELSKQQLVEAEVVEAEREDDGAPYVI